MSGKLAGGIALTFIAGMALGILLMVGAAGGSGMTVPEAVLKDAGLTRPQIEASRFDIFDTERAAVEKNLGVDLGTLYLLTPPPDAKGYYTRIGGIDLAVITGPFFREDQAQQTSAHEIGHWAAQILGVQFPTIPEAEAWAERFRTCFGSPEARAPRWGPVVEVDPETCRDIEERLQKAKN